MRLRLGLPLGLVAFSIAAAIPHVSHAQFIRLGDRSGVAEVLADGADGAADRCENGFDPVILDLTIESEEGARYPIEFTGEGQSSVRVRRGNEVQTVAVAGPADPQPFELTGQIIACMTATGSGFEFHESIIQLGGPAYRYALDAEFRIEDLAAIEGANIGLTYITPVFSVGPLSRQARLAIESFEANSNGGAYTYLGALEFWVRGLSLFFDPLDEGDEQVEENASLQLVFSVLRAEN